MDGPVLVTLDKIQIDHQPVTITVVFTVARFVLIRIMLPEMGKKLKLTLYI